MGEQHSNAERVRGYLAKHHAKCPACAYELTGLDASQCPECGRVLLIDDLLPPKPFTRQWLVFRVCVWTIWAACAGVMAYYLISAFALGVRIQSRAWGAPGMLLAAALLLLDRAREAYQKERWPEFVRWLIRAAVIAALALGAFALLLYVLLNVFFP